MVTGWINSSGGGHDGGAGTVDSRGQNSNFTNTSTWNNWDNISTPAVNTSNFTNTTRFYDWTNPVSSVVTTTVTTEEASMVHALLFNSTPGVRSNCMPDPHMMCLKLGKRHYYEDMSAESLNATRRGKQLYPFQYPNPYYNSNSSDTPTGVRVTSSASVVARCQVEGCHVALGNVKEYYRKHKVCEIHSKAPKVVVSGLQQRFCQQCSRFHGVTEFDEAKRSCRRRLKGHNQRRRKGTHSMMEQRLGPSNPGCALSLLSYPETQPWNPSGDLSSRCSAALYELIAANRATSSSVFLNQSVALGDTQMWDDTTTTTGEVKQGPALEFGLLSMKSKDPEAEEWTDYCWPSFGGANLM